MNPVPAIRSEFTRYRRQVERAVEQIDDEDLHRRLDDDGNSVAILVRHLSGNLRSRFTDFLDSDGEKPWRHRDREFEEPSCGRAELFSGWEEAWDVLDGALDEVEALGDSIEERRVTIRGQPLTVFEALLRSVAHIATHAGQVVLLARHWAGPSWRTLSIARGQSESYVADPSWERGEGEPNR